MGLGKITRTVGKVGIALEVGRYVFLAGQSLWRAIKPRKHPPTSNHEPDSHDHRGGDDGSPQ
jgi:hypothetical protein